MAQKCKTTSMSFLNKYIFIILHYLCLNQKIETSVLRSWPSECLGKFQHRNWTQWKTCSKNVSLGILYPWNL